MKETGGVPVGEDKTSDLSVGQTGINQNYFREHPASVCVVPGSLLPRRIKKKRSYIIKPVLLLYPVERGTIHGRGLEQQCTTLKTE